MPWPGRELFMVESENAKATGGKTFSMAESDNPKLSGRKAARVLTFDLPRGQPIDPNWRGVYTDPRTGHGYEYRGTCVGSSEMCRERCYAKTLSRNPKRSSWYNRCKINFAYVNIKGYLPPVGNHPSFGPVDYIRLHVSGDIFSVDYAAMVEAWAKDYPGITMLLYTRAWRSDIPGIDSALVRLARQPNVALWLSADATTDLPPKALAKRIPVAYMTDNDQDFENPLKRVALVFRSFARRQTKQRNEKIVYHLGDAPVCPAQTGDPDYGREEKSYRDWLKDPKEMPTAVPCFACEYCFDPTREMLRKVWEKLPDDDGYSGYGNPNDEWGDVGWTLWKEY